MINNEIIDVKLNHKHKWYIDEKIESCYILRCNCGEAMYTNIENLKNYI